MSNKEVARPAYAIPAVGEAIRVYDASRWSHTVPAVYIGFEQVADDFFMHRVRSESDEEELIAPYNVYRTTDGEHWDCLVPKPRIR
jgi:hypothetical protein